MRERVLQTAHGTRSEAFGPAEWGLVSAVALMWGSSFLWIDIGLAAFRPPIALALVASAFYGLAANLAVPLQQRYGAMPVIFRAQLVALVVVAPLGLAGLPGSRWSWGSAFAMVVLGVLGTGVAYVASSTLLGRVGPTRRPVPIYLIPVVALFLGVAFRDEHVADAAFVGIGLVLFGAYLAGRRERARPGELASTGDSER
jgi:drug/metabolite transporter (DMT)-like permease